MTETHLDVKLREGVLIGLRQARMGLSEAWYSIDETGHIEDSELVKLKHKIA